MVDQFAEASLFDMEPEITAPVSLRGLYVEPPFTMLDRTSGRWQERKRQWINSLGIHSELGRADSLVFSWGTDYLGLGISETSVFDPVTCELVYRWWSQAGDRVLDPFAGGSVRGIVASALDRGYTGIDIRPEQVAANEAQVAGWPAAQQRPRWVTDDAANLLQHVQPGSVDLVFTCPPYGDLEVYSDDPSDLSAMDWAGFLQAYQGIINDAVEALAPDRFFAIVVGDFRAKTGEYRGLPMWTQRFMVDAGLHLYTEAIIRDPIGSIRMTGGRVFAASRKLGRVHQQLFVGVKGSWKRAADRLRDARAEAEAEGADLLDEAAG